MEQYFAQYDDFTDLQKQAMAYGVIEGEALSWYHQRQKMLLFRSWEDLRDCLLLRFGDRDDPQLIKLLAKQWRDEANLPRMTTTDLRDTDLRKVNSVLANVEPVMLNNALEQPSKETPPVRELMDVNGFQVLSSQVDFLNVIFEKHPDIAIEFRPKNPHLRKACMTLLLSLIETLCQPPQNLSNEDLVEADNALTYVKASGFKVDWLEKRLEEVKEKKVEEQNGEIRIQELEEGLNELKQKCLDMEAMLEKEKAKVLAARASLKLEDVLL
ncbi:MATH domain and coiled-coil domain-containing protein At3g58210 [Capsella rubella]|nr:MATH domain and coiled-coil domain-containing protein At3g58210 [Capsella rubella]